jgi:transposase
VVVPCDLPEGATVIGEETSTKLGWLRGGPVKLVVVRTKYKVETDAGPLLETTPKPPELLERSLAAPSLLAHIAIDKFADGLPLYRQQQRYERVGLPLDRGTMSRWLEDLGATCGATVVEAMRKDALEHAFCTRRTRRAWPCSRFRPATRSGRHVERATSSCSSPTRTTSSSSTRRKGCGSFGTTLI